MTKYVAMIRAVGPENPNMRGVKFKWAFEELGFSNVQPFLTSGNVMFESSIQDTAKLEAKIEKALPTLLDFSRDVFVRSQAALQTLVDANPFPGLKHENAGANYLTITFFKASPSNIPPLPHQPTGKHFKLLTQVDGSLCCVVDLAHGKTTELMPWLERQYGKHITTRTWNTVVRTLSKLSL